MKTKHIFVHALDVSDLVPFTLKKDKSVKKSLEQQEQARIELSKFIELLEKNLGEDIYYMGMDIISEKTYERFMFKKSGFFEIMVESPLAMIAHFVDEKRGKEFRKALVKTLKKVIPPNAMSQLFLESIEVQGETDQSLTYDKWEKMTRINQ